MQKCRLPPLTQHIFAKCILGPHFFPPPPLLLLAPFFFLNTSHRLSYQITLSQPPQQLSKIASSVWVQGPTLLEFFRCFSQGYCQSLLMDFPDPREVIPALQCTAQNPPLCPQHEQMRLSSLASYSSPSKIQALCKIPSLLLLFPLTAVHSL